MTKPPSLYREAAGWHRPTSVLLQAWRLDSQGACDLETQKGEPHQAWGEGGMRRHFLAILQVAAVGMELMVAHFAAPFGVKVRHLLWPNQGQGVLHRPFLSDSPGFLCFGLYGSSDFSSGSMEVTPYWEPHPRSDLCPTYVSVSKHHCFHLSATSCKIMRCIQPLIFRLGLDC